MDPSSDQEQAKRRSLAPIRRVELRETARYTSRVYAIAVGVIALAVLIFRLFF